MLLERYSEFDLVRALRVLAPLPERLQPVTPIHTVLATRLLSGPIWGSFAQVFRLAITDSTMAHPHTAYPGAADHNLGLFSMQGFLDCAGELRLTPGKRPEYRYQQLFSALYGNRRQRLLHGLRLVTIVRHGGTWL